MKEGSRYLDSWRKEKGQHSIFERSFVERRQQVGLFLLVSPFGELVLFPPFVLDILNLYFKHLSSHLRRLFFSIFWWALSSLIPRFLLDT